MTKILLILLGSVYLSASSAFITSSELEKKIDSSNLVIIDVTDEESYKAGHIPSAIRANVGDFRYKVKQYQLMKSSSEIENIARSLGINNNSQIVLYGHGKSKELLKASYIALSLIVNGAKNVSILDGGYADWLDEQGPESTSTPVIKKGDFVAQFNNDVLVDLEYTKKNIDKTPMIEARPLKFFDGTAKSKGVRRVGHIKGAMSSYWKDKFNQDETIVENDKLKEIYIQGHKLNPSKELIVYCTGGLEASMNWYITSEHMGFKDVKVYDASMREWGNRDDTPMEK